jgi:hypothetical protein
MTIPISARERGSHQMPAQLIDLSCGGCRIAGVFLSRSMDKPVWIRIPGLESLTTARAWSSDGSHGLAFERPLHPAVFQRIANLYAAGDTSVAHASAPVLAVAKPHPPSSSRIEQIKAGYVLPDPGVLLDKRPMAGGKSLMTLVRRNTARKADHRGEPRFPAPEAVELVVGLGRERLEVENLSRGGLMASGRCANEIGDRVEVRFAGCEAIWGTVIWRRGEQLGMSLPAGSIELEEAAPAL